MNGMWIAPFGAGLVATTALTLVVFLPSWFGLPKANMVLALGKFIAHEKKLEQGLIPGLIVHYAVGIVFAWAYLLGFLWLEIPFSVLTGAMVGTVHGCIAMFVVGHLFLRGHPPQPSQGTELKARIAAWAQLAGHILYGSIVVGIYEVMVLYPR